MCTSTDNHLVFASIINGEIYFLLVRSLGNNVCQTKTWKKVDTKSKDTIFDDMKESESASTLLGTPGTCSAYLMAATDTVVKRNV